MPEILVARVSEWWFQPWFAYVWEAPGVNASAWTRAGVLKKVRRQYAREMTRVPRETIYERVLL